MIESTAAAILAGGQSRRMGTNKALLRARPDGPTLVEVVAARVREAGLEPALLVTNTPDDFAFTGFPLATDIVPGAGPLGGILTALVHLPQPRVFIVACDMPQLNPVLIRYMAALPDDTDAIVPRWTDDTGQERIETLHAIYSRRCIEPLRKRIDTGHLKAADFLHDIPVRYLTDDESRPFNPHISFRNVNTPEEWNL